jgi:outer membrane protein
MNKKILATSLLALSLHSAADSLLDIYNDALENDPQYKSAEFSYLSGKEIKVQGRAGLLPIFLLMHKPIGMNIIKMAICKMNTITSVHLLD